ncbi:MAG: S8 family peptidase [Deltaproteobacteria bacterium]|nr:S8 family peptidase [Deltaproteobacteria bacterium]
MFGIWSPHGTSVLHCPRFSLGTKEIRVNNGHPLLDQALDGRDLFTIDPAWGVNDAHGHGTEMAGLALFGDLTPLLASNTQIEIRHRLESVKLLRQPDDNIGDSRHHGNLTLDAISQPEAAHANRRRVFSMAVTARDRRDRGRPSAWSATVDRLAVGSTEDREPPRLIIIAAGNIEDTRSWFNSPESNTTASIHDPGQAWNALTVGAHTDLTRITEADAQGYTPVANQGGLSPFSSTSATWQAQWPLKPDVVFEGANVAKDHASAHPMSSLSLLTTFNNHTQRLFTKSNATSAATALAAQMAAKLMAEYPTLRPETIRALIVHSAEWTEEMKRYYLPRDRGPNMSDYVKLIRHCGYGVPDLDRALWSVSNSLTLVVESELRPFERREGHQPTLRDMNVHRLPWPLVELEALGATEVEMRVTLSYFIEPNPSQRGVRSRYRYESYGLRFDVKRAHESERGFRARVNAAARNEETGLEPAGTDTGWLIGINNRHKGSIHSDIWKGTAAELASKGVLGVYPAPGWWKTRPGLNCFNKSARYSFLVSIRAPEVGVDLYTAIANQIAVPVQVGV